MMVRFKFLLLWILIGISVTNAKEHTDTIWTTGQDRIILTYDIVQTDKEVNICFQSAQKKLGYQNRQKYKKVENIDAVFFDKTGIYEDAVFSNMVPEAFMRPANLEYISPNYSGFFFLRDRPEISFKKLNKKIDKLTIPIYLTYRKGKGKYELFAESKELEITIEAEAPKSREDITNPYNSQPLIDTITTTLEIEEEDSETLDALERIDLVEDLLSSHTHLPFPEMLQQNINRLQIIREDTENRELRRRIDETLQKYEEKKAILEKTAAQEVKDEQIAAQEKADKERQMEVARQDSINAVQAQKAEAEEKRNFWLIIGGGILAALCFIGNQLLRHFSNIKNQKNMMEMQQHIAHQAENEAKRQAQNYSRKKANEVANQIKKNGQEMVGNKIKSSGNKQKPKKFSI